MVTWLPGPDSRTILLFSMYASVASSLAAATAVAGVALLRVQSGDHDPMLSSNEIKEELSYAYLHAVAASAGFSVTRPTKDRDSVDAVVEADGQLDSSSVLLSPRLEVQLKATELKKLPNRKFSYPVPIKNYNDLRGRRAVPRILVVLVLPHVRAKWLTHSVKGLVARKCAYWCSLLGLPDSTNTTTQTVHVSCRNRVTPDALVELLKRVSKGEELRT